MESGEATQEGVEGEKEENNEPKEQQPVEQ